MRSDFYPLLHSLPTLAALKEAGSSMDLLPPTTDEIREIILGPARAAGLDYEDDPDDPPGLAERLEKAASQQEGALPLLEYTLDELFNHRDKEKTP